MLVRFAVENFRSFSEQAQISMVANGRMNRMDDHTVSLGDLKLLKGAYVYGANASGKSNLIKAVRFARRVILDGSARNVRLNQYSKLRQEGSKHPGVFQFEMAIKDKIYSYGFALSYQDGSIVEEWLYELRHHGGEICIFARENQKSIVSDLNLKDDAKLRFRIYSEDIKSVPRDLFLTELAEKPLHDELGIFSEIYKWFKNLVVIFPGTEFRPLPFIIENEKMRKQFEKYLSHFDTGIDEVAVEETDLAEELGHWPRDIAEEFVKDVVQQLTDDKEFGVRGPGVLLALHRSEESEVIAKKLHLKHSGALEGFDLRDESDGTQRLFDLVPLLFGDLENRVIFIDEIDRSMHPSLTVEFVELFYRQTKGQNVQMLATTHESALLDLSRIRQDEIWFVERQHRGSKLTSLDDFKVRFDKQIEKDYLLGRYGAVPLFGQLVFNEQEVLRNGKV